MTRAKLDGILFETEQSAERKQSSDNATIKETFLDNDGMENSAFGRIKDIFQYTIHDKTVQVVECRWFEQVGINEKTQLAKYTESTRVEWQEKRFQFLKYMCAENFLMVPNDGPDVPHSEPSRRMEYNFLAKP